jgi:predicted transcriptional regulator of viral defense system
MKKTALSQRDLNALERIIAKHGSIVTSSELRELFPEYSYGSLGQEINALATRGWLIRIKRGVYAVASLESHSFATISPLVVAQVLVPGSYVSFEFALNHHGLFDQLPATVASVTPLKSKTYEFQDMEYRFVKAKAEMMTGFAEVSLEGRTARVADVEKALIDFLHFRKDTYTVDLVREKLEEAREELSADKLARYVQEYPIVLKRRLGFLLDAAEISSEELHAQIARTPGFARLTPTAKKFNAKWRVYA